MTFKIASFISEAADVIKEVVKTVLQANGNCLINS